MELAEIKDLTIVELKVLRFKIRWKIVQLKEKLAYIKGKFNHYPNCEGCTRKGNCLTNWLCGHMPNESMGAICNGKCFECIEYDCGRHPINNPD